WSVQVWKVTVNGTSTATYIPPRLGAGASDSMPPKQRAGERVARVIESFQDALEAAKPRPSDTSSQADKKNYAQRLSEALAVLVANRLRPTFPAITPLADGTRQESKARTGKGVKKLDVNYSTPELGLGLGVS